MALDKAKCPHCESLVAADDLDELEIEDGTIAPMGMGKSDPDVLYVCPSCNTILG